MSSGHEFATGWHLCKSLDLSVFLCQRIRAFTILKIAVSYQCIVCQLLDTAYPAPNICRNSDIRPEVSVLPGSDLKEMSLPLSSWALIWTSVLNSPFQTLSTWLDFCQISCMDGRPLQNDNLPSLCPFLLWGASGSFCTLCQILHNPAPLLEPTLWYVTDPSYMGFFGKLCQTRIEWCLYTVFWNGTTLFGGVTVGKTPVHWSSCTLFLPEAHCCGLGMILRCPQPGKNVEGLTPS